MLAGLIGKARARCNRGGELHLLVRQCVEEAQQHFAAVRGATRGGKLTKRLLTNVNRLLCDLTPREQLVLRIRFGIGGPVPYAEEASARCGFSRVRVEQIETRALRKLRARSLR